MEIAFGIIGIISLIITVISVIYTIKANQDKERLEEFIKLRLENICSSLEDGKKDTKSAYQHVEKMRKFLTNLKQTDELRKLLDCATWAQQDVASAERMMIRLKDDVDAFNRRLYGKKDADNTPQVQLSNE